MGQVLREVFTDGVVGVAVVSVFECLIDVGEKMRMEERKRPSPLGIRGGGARVSAVDREEGKDMDLSGMALDSMPSPALNLAVVTKLDLSNNNLEVRMT